MNTRPSALLLTLLLNLPLTFLAACTSEPLNQLAQKEEEVRILRSQRLHAQHLVGFLDSQIRIKETELYGLRKKHQASLRAEQELRDLKTHQKSVNRQIVTLSEQIDTASTY